MKQRKVMYRAAIALLSAGMIMPTLSPAAAVPEVWQGAAVSSVLTGVSGNGLTGVSGGSALTDPSGSTTGGWVRNGADWFYIDPANGQRSKGWLLENGRWYFLDPTPGEMFGRMLTGWQWIDGYCYYFYPGEGNIQGMMYAGMKTPDGYEVDQSGHWMNGGNAVHEPGRGISTEGLGAVAAGNTGYALNAAGTGASAVSAAVTGSGSLSTLPAGTLIARGRYTASGGFGSGSGGSGGSSSKGSGSGKKGSSGKDGADKADSLKETAGGNKKDDAKQTADDTKKDDALKPGDGTQTGGGSGKDEEQKPDSKPATPGDFEDEEDKIIFVSAVLEPESIRLDFVDEKPDSYRTRLPRSIIVRYKKNGGVKQRSLKITGWSWDIDAGESPAAGATCVLVPEYDVPELLLDIEDEIRRDAVSLQVVFEAAQEEEPIEDNDAEIIGYIQPEDITTDYVKGSTWRDYGLPEKVTFELSNGHMIEASVYGWTPVNEVKAGAVTTYQVSMFNDLPGSLFDLNERLTAYVQAHPVKMNVTFNAQEETKEITITWDREAGGYGTPTYTYSPEEDPVMTLTNYEGDGSDISLTRGWPGLTLTVGSGLVYNSEAHTVTVLSDELLKSEYRESNYMTVRVGEKSESVYINYQSGRQAEPENYGWGGYSNVSRKKDFVTRITFTGVPEEDIRNITFTASSVDVTGGLLLEATGEDNVYRLTVPYAAVSDYLTSGYSGDSVTLKMHVKYMADTEIRITYMAAPSVTADQTKPYYASQDPVLTLKNFSWDQAAKDELAVSVKDNTESGSFTALQADSDFSFDTENDKLTIHSAAVLGTDKLSEDREITVRVEAAADGESAEIIISYRREKEISVEDTAELAPYTGIKAKITGYESGDTVQVFCNGKELSNVKVTTTGSWGDYTYWVTIPYDSFRDYREEDEPMTLTVRVTGAPETTFTASFAKIPETGDPVPVRTDAVGDSYGDEVTATQDGLPKVVYTGSISVIPVEDCGLSADQWLNMGATIRKKGDSEDNAVIVGVDSVKTNWSTGGVKAVGLNSLYSHKDEMDALDDFDSYEDGTWPVYTVALYLPGYVRTEIDVVLFKYKW